jgi:hypothetical protein
MYGLKPVPFKLCPWYKTSLANAGTSFSAARQFPCSLAPLCPCSLAPLFHENLT